MEVPTSMNIPSFEEASPKTRKRCYLPNGKPRPSAIRDFPEGCTPYVHNKPQAPNTSSVTSYYEIIVQDTSIVETCTGRTRVMPDRKAKQKLPKKAYKERKGV